MTQKTDLNISPYYDDFDPAKNYHKVLFKPGFPVQARELTTLQSILQNQIKDFGDHMFKEGSIVIPGAPTLDIEYNAVKLQATQFSIDISLYTTELIGKTLTGQTSGVSAIVSNVVLPNGGDVEDITIYVQYVNSSVNDFETTTFVNGEGLFCTTNVTYGNTTINSGTVIATLITADAIATGSAASVAAGIYFVRGNFVNVTSQTIILDHYTSNPTYRVGLQINEEIIGAKDDSSLYDNAKGFTNYAAPGADRLKISLVLTKKNVEDKDDTNFIEILRANEGKVRKIVEDTNYNLIKEWIAGRTFDESGNYAIDSFDISVNNSLRDRIANAGLKGYGTGIYEKGETTEEGNEPSKDLACYKVSGGEAYVRGYDVRTDTTNILDVEKPRDTEKVESANVPFEMGNRIQVNNVHGQPAFRRELELCSNVGGYAPVDGTQPFQPTGIARFPGIIGRARLYEVNTADSVYEDATTMWDAYLYDVTFFTYICINRSVSEAVDGLVQSVQVKGKNSGAIGYLYAGTGGGTVHLTVSDKKGEFQIGEALIFNGVESPSVSIVHIDNYSMSDVKSVYQYWAEAADRTNYPSTFTADLVLENLDIPNIQMGNLRAGAGSTELDAGGTQFVGVKTGDIISYAGGWTDIVYNRVDSISADNLQLSMAGGVGINTNAPGIYKGWGSGANDRLVGFSTGSIRIQKKIGSLRNVVNQSLVVKLPELNISSVDLSASELVISAQVTGETVASNTMTIPIADVTDGSNVAVPAGSFFESFKADRFAVFQTGSSAGVAPIRSDQVTNTGTPDTLTITGLPNLGSVANVTVKKNGIISKVKNLSKSNILDVNLSRNSQSGIGNSTLNDGLTYNSTAYGLRVQDEEISLNVPDVVNVLAVHESLNISEPTLDLAEFSASASVATGAIIGENIKGEDSNAIARVVINNGSTPSSGDANKLGIIYLNDNTFEIGETVKFEESNIETIIVSTTNGSYANITSSFRLDKGQREQYYDYSRLVRKTDTSVPFRRLMVVLDKYSVPANDRGDAFTVLSYPEDAYGKDIPMIGSGESQVSASDVLDFRPRVDDWVGVSSSPFFFMSRNEISYSSGGPKWIAAPKEASILGYEFYLGRIDKIYLDQNAQLQVQKGESAVSPRAPENLNSSMELATISLPPYLYDPNDAIITLTDNRRYTMRDIGLLEDRIEDLETVTTLSLLEVSTESLQIQDAEGRNRFKSGFFVDNFTTNELIDYNLGASLTVETEEKLIRPIIARNSLDSYLMPAIDITDENYDSTDNYELLDSNVQKTGNAVTLKYEEIGWIEQPLATRVANVNEFHVLAFKGTIELNPSSDNWVRTIRLDDNIIERTNERVITTRRSEIVWNNWRRFTRRQAEVSALNGRRTETNLDVRSSDVVVDTGDEEFMRSRNTAVLARSLRGNTRHYHFLDGESGIDFIPKLIEIATDNTLENSGSDGVFRVGETVFGYDARGNRHMSFRVAQSNHKLGSFNGTTSNNDPLTVYGSNPYNPSENVQARYTATSPVLNVDTNALAKEAQGLYYGWVKKGFKLVGQASGAIAYVKDIRLITDSVGDLLGSFFIRTPHKTPAPDIMIRVGKIDYSLSNKITGAKPIKGSKLGSYANTTYETRGRYIVRQRNITRTTNITHHDTQIDVRFEVENDDPLAQSFMVASDIEAPDPNANMDDDQYGAYITSADVWFATKDPGNAPITAQIRTVELGIPSKIAVGPSVTLTPDQVQVSENASVATNFKFPQPIYLAPGRSYALVLLSPISTMYEVWTARFGETTVETQDLPKTQAITYGVQWAMGSLFLSQNGSVWSPIQTDDLKMKLYKAKFTSTEGTAYFANPTLNISNGYTPVLQNNPIVAYPKNGQIRVTGVSTYAPREDGSVTGQVTGAGAVLVPGVKIQGETGDNTAVNARVEGFGFSIKTGTGIGALPVTNGGIGYESDGSTTVSTFALTGKGSGITIKIAAVNADGTINSATGITTVATGHGYQVGDVIGLTTSTTKNAKGTGALFAVSLAGVGVTDTMFLTNIQGTDAADSFKTGKKINYYDENNVLVTSGSVPTYSADLVTAAFPYEGNTFRVDQFDHDMHSGSNKLTLENIRGTEGSTPLTANMTNTSTTLSVGAANLTPFQTFEGVAVSGNNLGYVRVEDEIISYTGTSGDNLTGLTRGVDGTLATSHTTFNMVEKYEANGVSLCRINKTHTIASTGIGLNSYYVNYSRAATTTTKARDVDVTGSPNTAQLSFENEVFFGGDAVNGTSNIQFDAIVPNYGLMTPGGVTEVSASARTISGTSIDGNEASFLDQGYQPIQLNTLNEFTTPRLVASKVNEDQYLTAMARNKSFTTAIKFNTTNQNVSPILYMDIANTEFRSNLLNNPINNYPTDSRVNSPFFDPHAAIYVSNSITLDNPADSLKVIFDAVRSESSSIRVLYALNGEQEFRLFPGYNNLDDTTGDGYGDKVVNPALNDGLSDAYVSASVGNNEYKEYQYSVDNLEEFETYRIKIVMAGTNQAQAPKIKNLRTLALL